MILPIQAYADHYFNILGAPLKWNHTDFTFYTPKNPELIMKALKTISLKTDNTFTFTRVDNPKIADIIYEYNERPINDSDAYGFTNYLSTNRTISKVVITIDVSLKSYLLYYTTIHESLHALGLNHNSEPNSIMTPPYKKGKIITDTDIEHLLLLYLQPKMPVSPNCEEVDWLLCWYVQGRINENWQSGWEITLLEYDLVNNCGTYMIKLPTHNITPYELRIAFWNEDQVVSIVRMNITSWMEYTLCTSQHQDGITAGLY